jgi:hypothetical protein
MHADTQSELFSTTSRGITISCGAPGCRCSRCERRASASQCTRPRRRRPRSRLPPPPPSAQQAPDEAIVG